MGFEEDDEHDRPPPTGLPPASQHPAEPLSGHADGVTVTVDEAAEIRDVSLDRGWRRLVDPRRLGDATLAAANEATMRALAKQVEQPPESPDAPAPPPYRPITPQDAVRLLDEVAADLTAFTRRLAEATGPVSVESQGGHVHGTSHGGRVTALKVDPQWVNQARDSELIAELREVLAGLRVRSAPAHLAAGPDSPAIAELNALARDPHTLLRGLGLLP
ncbi:hypothetical protein ABZ816_38730 [Actinosynnema sp. NPDC047251]|uniref:YbaB/EbfC family nucleoid-associated protein n=1 Tax=Saccharothrix espanaensis TaxID=103731 RepID=UPI00031F7693|nr:YbaB/EbfC family nucleoid-associated protein [Saccharothrix espanaensis]